jgi:hypothetical protein
VLIRPWDVVIGGSTLAQLFVEGEVEQDGTSSIITDGPVPAATVRVLQPEADKWLVVVAIGGAT